MFYLTVHVGVVIEVQATNDVAVELGALKYVSNLTGYGMDIVVNCFLIIIMIVFQPLAIALILAALFAFGNKKEEEKVESVEPVVLPTPDDKPEPVFVPEEKTKRRYKKRENKIPDDTEMDYPKTFDIQIEGLEPGEVLFPQEEQKEEIPEVVEEPKSEPVKEKKTRRRKVVERGLPEDLAAHISNSLSKKKP